MKKLAIIITHPIQYYVPMFRQLAKQCDLKVFYSWGKDSIKKKYDPGFCKEIAWDIPLFDGYDYHFTNNTSKNPGSHHYMGIINPHLINEIKVFSPNAILIYGYAYQSHFKVMRHFKGKIPIWFRGDSTLLDNEFSWRIIIKYFYLKWIYSYIDKAFYVGENNKSYFKKYGMKLQQLIFAPHAIENNRFSKENKINSLVVRRNLNINDNEILILFAGKFETKKDPEILLEAFINLHQDNELTLLSVHLLFVGNGILEQKLKQRAMLFNNQIIKSRVHFMDFQNQSKMPAIYQACNLFCLPSKGPHETWGLAINEAMAAKKAILCSDKVGCAKDLVLNGNGAIFKAGNINDLKLKINQLLNTNNRLSQIDTLLQLNKMGEISESIIQDWSFKKQVNTFIKELKNCGF